MIEKFGEVIKKTYDSMDIKKPTIGNKDFDPIMRSKLNYEPLYKSEIKNTHLPKNDGAWSGERGNSKWTPDSEKIPNGRTTNSSGQNWGEILKKHDIDGIDFKDGEPNFKEVAKETVEIDNFTEKRSKNFMQADEKLAKQLNCSPDDIRKMRQEEGYTWHERKDCKTMDLVPSEIHNNIPHSGGISETKNK